MNARRAAAALVIAAAWALPCWPPARAAAGSGSLAHTDEAIRLYKRGRSLLEQHKYDEALAVLAKSQELLPSPNTALLEAHALRQLGRLGEAMGSYQSVMQDASERVRKGEKRYQPTLAEAGRWSTMLRGKVGELSIVVDDAPPGVTLVVGDSAADAERDSTAGRSTARIWREPGTVSVVARSDDGREVTKEAQIIAGGSATVALQFPKSTPAVAEAGDSQTTPSPRPDGAPMVGPPLASYIAFGAGVAGIGVFAAFGAMSASTASDLDKCAPRCPMDLRDAANRGETHQTVANIGLIAGAAGITAGATIWLVTALTADPSDKGAAGAVRVGPSGVEVVGRF